ncbi:DUF6049 family protein [Agromyces salentinus]|uniref:Uncharacterized protein n=1 Tax=Agromyces salentinus TaxID=269421 RepID=A0ABP4YPI7_9MICO|nr:DUF6049 family protein [Agromyces salentinus]
MVADSNAGRRRARRRFGSTGASGAHDETSSTSAVGAAGRPRRRWVRRSVIAVSAFGVAAAVVAPLAAQAGGIDPVTGIRDVLVGAASSATRSDAVTDSTDAAASASMSTAQQKVEEGVDISIAPTISTTFTPGAAGSAVAVSVELENLSGSFLEEGRLRLVRAGSPIEASGDLDAWLAGATSGFSTEPVALGESPTRGLATGAIAQVAFTVPAEAFADVAGSPVIGLGAELRVGDVVVATQTSALANTASTAAGAAPIALVAPLTVPTATTGLIGIDELAAWTAPDGTLSTQLDALAGREVAIGIDPRVIASIRSLGSAAPPEALEWLQRLADVPNETFPLAYADADLALQSQIGLSAPLVPESFADVLDPDDFVQDPAAGDQGDLGVGQPEATEAPAETAPTPSESPTPTPTAPVSTVPDTAELLAWSYTRTDIAWPGDTTVAPGDISFFNAAGMTTSILDSANVEDLPGARTSALVDGGTAIVSDQDLTSAVRDAAAATSDLEWRDAASEVLARATLDGAQDSTIPLLATFSRSAGEDPERVGELLVELAGSQFVTPTGLAQAIGAPPTPRSLVDSIEGEGRRSLAQAMVSAESDVASFSSLLAEPADLTGPTRRDLLALLDVGWLATTPEWSAASTEWLTAQRALVDSVSVVPSSSVLVVASSTGIPITVQNTSAYAVTVEVDVAPSNGRLVVDEPVQVTVEPESRNTVSVPVAAGVGNGEVLLMVSLTSLTGVAVGSTVVIQADVQADWEGIGAAVLGGILIVVFGIGIWRNIRRRRRQRAAETAAAAETDVAGTETAPDADVEPDAETAPGTEERHDAEETRDIEDARGDTDARPDGRRDG